VPVLLISAFSGVHPDIVMASTDELAEDYKASLEDLTFNSRYEIGNLTVIARENIQSAQAIARTLETHIHQVGYPLPLLVCE
jgi:hypothetical protein